MPCLLRNPAVAQVVMCRCSVNLNLALTTIIKPGKFANFFVAAVISRWGYYRTPRILSASYCNTCDHEPRFDRSIASDANRIEWVEGIWRKSKCYYGRNPFITFRVSR